MKYKVGDKVMVNDKEVNNKSCKIIEVDRTRYLVQVTENGYCRWFIESELSPQLPFPIGTKVKCSYQDGSSFTGIFRGQSETFQCHWAIERDDNTTGGGQNSWWNWDKSYGIKEVKDTTVDLIADYTEPLIFSREALELAEQLGEYKPLNHLIDNKFMSIKNKIKMLMTGEPEKTLIKHGILTVDKELTVEGKQLFSEFIETKFKEEFLKGLYEVLKDEKLED